MRAWSSTTPSQRPRFDRMKLHPAVAEQAEANRPVSLDHLSVVEQRRFAQLRADLNFLRFGTPGPLVAAVEDHFLSVDGESVRLRIYRSRTNAALPVHLRLHGGGWWQGSIDYAFGDAQCRRLCMEADVAVADVDYRLAPEHPYPSGLDDAYAALVWLVENSSRLNLDASRVSIGGVSAGGNLAAAVTHRARDEGGPPLIFQVLEVPCLDLTLASAEAAEATGRTASIVAALRTAIDQYLPASADARDPSASPLLASDFSRLPPALIRTAELDPLHAEGELYGEKLAKSGVGVRVIRCQGALHGSLNLTRTWRPAADWHNDVAAALRAAHWSLQSAGPFGR